MERKDAESTQLPSARRETGPDEPGGQTRVQRPPPMIQANEIRPGVVQVVVYAAPYGQAGAHWRRVLAGTNHNGYGRIFIQRFGANQRRYWHCYGPGDWYRGEIGANMDECPGAMFIWPFSLKHPSVEAVDAVDNQRLGRDMGQALRKFSQVDANDLWEVLFRFI
jgi:hypothetical protein